MTVYLKNGANIQIPQEIAEIIGKRIFEGAKDWQVFSTEEGQVKLILKLSEITHIS